MRNYLQPQWDQNQSNLQHNCIEIQSNLCDRYLFGDSIVSFRTSHRIYPTARDGVSRRWKGIFYGGGHHEWGKCCCVSGHCGV